MKKTQLLTLFFILLISYNAQAGFLGYGKSTKIELKYNLPIQNEYLINDGTDSLIYFDLAIKYERFELFWTPLWTISDPVIVGVSEGKNYALSNAQIETILKVHNLNKNELITLSFFDKHWGFGIVFIFFLISTIYHLIINSFDPKSGWNAKEGVYYAKGSYNNAIEYHNELICCTNSSQQFFQLILDGAEGKIENFKVTETLNDWKNSVFMGILDSEKIGAFKNDDILLKECLIYLSKMEMIIIDFKVFKDQVKNKEITDVHEITNSMKNYTEIMNSEFIDMQKFFQDFLKKYD